MRVLLCKFCEYVTKLENGRHTLVGVFDDIRSNAFPVDHPTFFVAFQLEFEREEMGQKMDVAARFVDPDNNEVFRSDLTGEVPSNPALEHVRLFFFGGIQPIKLQKPGNYRILISNQGDIVHIEHLPVYQVQTTPAAR